MTEQYFRCRCGHLEDTHVNDIDRCVIAKCNCIEFDLIPRQMRMPLPGEPPIEKSKEQ